MCLILKLDFSNLPERKYELQKGMFEGETSILLGFKASCQAEDGYYLIDNLDVKKQ